MEILGLGVGSQERFDLPLSSFIHSFIFNTMGPSDMLDTVNTMMNKAHSLHPSCLHLVIRQTSKKILS